MKSESEIYFEPIKKALNTEGLNWYYLKSNVDATYFLIGFPCHTRLEEIKDLGWVLKYKIDMDWADAYKKVLKITAVWKDRYEDYKNLISIVT